MQTGIIAHGHAQGHPQQHGCRIAAEDTHQADADVACQRAHGDDIVQRVRQQGPDLLQRGKDKAVAHQCRHEFPYEKEERRHQKRRRPEDDASRHSRPASDG